MKQVCINCDKTFYPTVNNWIGYPQAWPNREQELPTKVFHSRGCMDSFLTKNANILSPIYKQIKEREARND